MSRRKKTYMMSSAHPDETSQTIEEVMSRVEDVETSNVIDQEGIDQSEAVVNEEIAADETNTQPDTSAPQETHEMVESTEPNSPVTVHVKFVKNSVPVRFMIAATGQEDVIVAANGEIMLMQSRFYMIPVDTEADSDQYGNLKVLSERARDLDVRYIKDGFACVMPLRHNVTLRNGDRLCYLW